MSWRLNNQHLSQLEYKILSLRDNSSDSISLNDIFEDEASSVTQQPSRRRDFDEPDSSYGTSKRGSTQSPEKENSYGLSKFARVLTGNRGNRSASGVGRCGRQQDEGFEDIHTVHREEVPLSVPQTDTSQVDKCCEDLSTGIQKSTVEMAQLIHDSVQSCTRLAILQDIICERRCNDYPPTLEQLQERMQYERYSPNKHSFILFSRHRLSGWEHTHAYHDCNWRKSWCPCCLLYTSRCV